MMVDREKALMESLSSATDARSRNAAAIALADLGSRGGIDMVRRLLHDPVTEGARGTLLYALHEAKAKIRLGELVDIMLTEAPEAREEAFTFLEDRLFFATPDDYGASIARLRSIASEARDEDQRTLARDALELLVR